MAKKKKETEVDEPSPDGTVPVNDAWTGLLAISLLALVVASGFLLYDYLQYEDPPAVKNYTGPKGPPPVQKDAGAVDKAADKGAADKGAVDKAADKGAADKGPPMPMQDAMMDKKN